MLVRRAGVRARSGPSTSDLPTGGDEEEWLRAAARPPAGGSSTWPRRGLDHRRAGDDARLRSLMRSAYRPRAQPARLRPPPRRRRRALGRELRVLAGCGWHTRAPAVPAGARDGSALRGAVEALRERCDAGAQATPPGLPATRDLPLRRVRARGRRPRARCAAAPGTPCSTPPCARTAAGAGSTAWPPRVPDARRARARRSTGRARAACPPSPRELLAQPAPRPPGARLDGARDAGPAAAHRAHGPGRGQVREPEPGARRLEAGAARAADWVLVVDDDVVLPDALPRPLPRRVRASRARPRAAGADAARATPPGA